MTPPLRRSPRLAFAAPVAAALGFGASQAWAAGAARDPCGFAWYGTCHSQAECAAVCESIGGAGSWSYCDGRDCCQCEFP
ncbi:MAG TPA: hypothetical protein VHG91_21270 [Longimicrobium sp.]|nr:hypothetical protein [Longimicrobium sp.]